MRNDDGALRLDERLRAKDELYGALLARRRGGVVPAALCLAALVGAGASLRSPTADAPSGGAPQSSPRVVRFELPPPPQRPPAAAPAPRAPSPTLPVRGVLPATDPIQDPYVTLDPNEPPPEAEILAGEPEPWMPAAPVPQAQAETTQPVLVPESRVEPVYPEVARSRGFGGALVLRILVLADGSVGEVSVLRSSRRNVGFEAAAASAIRRWRYHPATRDGAPVDATIFVHVRFNPRR